MPQWCSNRAQSTEVEQPHCERPVLNLIAADTRLIIKAITDCQGVLYPMHATGSKWQKVRFKRIRI